MLLGSTTKMDGCASVYLAIAAVFIGEFYGIDLSPHEYLLIVFVSVIHQIVQQTRVRMLVQ